MPYRIRGISNLMYTPEEMTVPRLSHNGTIVEGWVKAPTDKAWEPQDGDLLWLPPSATKSTDIDGIGRVVDVGPWTPGEDMAWVQAEINKHDRYLDYVRSKVRSGAMRLTAALAKMLGLDFGDGAELVPRAVAPAFRSAPLAAMKTAADLQADLQRMIDRTGSDVSEDRIKTIARSAAERFAATGDMSDALDSILRAIRAKSSPIDPDTGLPDLGGRS